MKLKMKKKNNQIFKEYFHYQDSYSLSEDLYEDNDTKTERIVKQLNESLIDLTNSVTSKKVFENENPNKIIL